MDFLITILLKTADDSPWTAERNIFDVPYVAANEEYIIEQAALFFELMKQTNKYNFIELAISADEYKGQENGVAVYTFHGWRTFVYNKEV